MIEFLFYLFFPLFLGGIGGLLSDTSMYQIMNKPSFSPPSIIFPIVWTILFLLMGFSSYLVKDNKKAMIIYYIQLVFNSLWTLIFFNFKLYFISFIWILVLIVLVILMIIEFRKSSSLASYLQIPYLLWLIFAAILSYNIFILN